MNYHVIIETKLLPDFTPTVETPNQNICGGTDSD